MENTTPQIAILIGSTREQSRTAKAARYVAARLVEDHGLRVDVLDPRDLVMHFPGQTGAEEFEAAISARVARADAVLLSTPEYHGSYSAVLKAFIDSLGYPSALEGKPIALLGVAAGRMGAGKSLEHLSGVCLHVGAMVLPGAVSIAQCYAAFGEDGACTLEEVREELDHLALILAEAVQGRLLFDSSIEHSTRN